MGIATKLALDLIEDVRGSVAMYMFILEEATQTAGMACYLYKKAEMHDKAAEVASWLETEIIDPALEFTRTYGHLAYPLESAYEAFFLAAKQTMKAYKEAIPTE